MAHKDNEQQALLGDFQLGRQQALITPWVLTVTIFVMFASTSASSAGSVKATLTETAALDPQRTGHTATLLKTGHVLVTGGHRTFGRMDPAIVKRLVANGVLPANDDAGSRDSWLSFVNDFADTAVYDPVKANWTAGPPMSTGRFGHAAALLSDGKVLVAGGMHRGRAGPPFVHSAEIYDPRARSWTSAGSMDEAVIKVPGADGEGRGARVFHTATLLLNGKVLVVGAPAGVDRHSSAYASDALLFDPATRSWKSTDSLGTSRGGHTASLLPNGKVLVAGGADFEGLASAEIYDPEAETWTPTRMGSPRAQHSATVLPDGKVLIAGGTDRGKNDGPISSVELYDPKTESFRTAAPLAYPRRLHAAAQLAGGRVLIAGGFAGDAGVDPVVSAEIFDPSSGRWATVPGSFGSEHGAAPAEITQPGAASATQLAEKPCGANCGKVLAVGGTFDAPLSHLVAAPLSAAGRGTSPSPLRGLPWRTITGTVALAFAAGLTALVLKKRHIPKDRTLSGGRAG